MIKYSVPLLRNHEQKQITQIYNKNTYQDDQYSETQQIIEKAARTICMNYIFKKSNTVPMIKKILKI